MKKIKVAMISLAIVLGTGAALATRQNYCESFPQYIKVGATYIPAGRYGFNYFCWDLPGVCTYYKPNPFADVYYPCRTGMYEAIY